MGDPRGTWGYPPGGLPLEAPPGGSPRGITLADPPRGPLGGIHGGIRGAIPTFHLLRADLPSLGPAWILDPGDLGAILRGLLQKKFFTSVYGGPL